MTKPTKFEASRIFGIYVFNGNVNYPFSVELAGFDEEEEHYRVSTVASLAELRAIKAAISNAIAYYHERQEEDDLP